jgi:dynein heavy chain 1
MYNLADRRIPLVLCGPPGLGKTMTLTSASLFKGVVLANLNFSSRTTPGCSQDIQSVLFIRSAWKDIVLEPSESLGAQSWLVVFCDEVNLPGNTYGTQRVIMFMRQLNMAASGDRTTSG